MRRRLLLWAWTRACSSMYVLMYKSAGQHMQVTWWSSLVSSFLLPHNLIPSVLNHGARAILQMWPWDRRKRASLKGKCLSGAARHPRLHQRCCFWSRWTCANLHLYWHTCVYANEDARVFVKDRRVPNSARGRQAGTSCFFCCAAEIRSSWPDHSKRPRLHLSRTAPFWDP